MPARRRCWWTCASSSRERPRTRWPLSAEAWAPQIPALQQAGYRTIAYGLIDIGTQMSVVRRPNGRFVAIDGIALDDAQREALLALTGRDMVLGRRSCEIFAGSTHGTRSGWSVIDAPPRRMV